MKLTTKLVTLVAFAALLCSEVSAVEPVPATYAGSIRVGSTPNPNGIVTEPTVVYDNLAAPSAVNAGLAPQSLGEVYGDRITLADTGYFDAITLSVFNPTDDGMMITTADLNLNIFDANTFDPTMPNVPLFSVTRSLDFTGFMAGGLSDGTFTLVTLDDFVATEGTAATAFTLSTTDLAFTQSLSNVAGGSTTGATFVTFSEDNIGSQFMDNDDFLIGSLGFVGFGAPTSNRVAASVTLTVPEPSSAVLGLVAMAGLGLLRRRR